MCIMVSLVPRVRLEGSKTKTPRFKTKTETKTCKNGSQDVSRPSLENSLSLLIVTGIIKVMDCVCALM